MLAKANRINKDYEFTKIRQRGNSARGKLLYFKYTKSTNGQNKIGIIISKKNIAKATQRNLIKRQIRYVVKKHLLKLNGVSLVIGLNNQAKEYTFKELELDYLNLISRIR